MKHYQIICMSFDGDYQRERPEFETIDDAWEYSNDLGSKWFFYPFHFVVSGNTIADAPEPMEKLKRKQIKTVKKLFQQLSEEPEMQGVEADEFVFNVHLLTI